MKVQTTALEGVLIIEPDLYKDDRGFFLETWQHRKYSALGIEESFVQDNLSRSERGVLRGLHFQEPNAQGKLVTVLSGSVLDVVVDVRRGSPTFGKWLGMELTAESRRQVWIPRGFAHGFCTTSESADFFYKCTGYYDRNSERTIRWDDPEIAVEWPIQGPIVSPKDRAAPFFKDCPHLPSWVKAK